MDLVEIHSGMLFATAYAILRNREDAQDAVQEAFIRAYRHLPRLGDPMRFAPWLRSIVRQQCCGFIRLWKRRLKLLEVKFSVSFWMAQPLMQEQPGINAFQQEIWERCLSVLNQRSREIVLLYYQEGYSCAQIADLLQVNEGVVKNNLHKARKRIEERLRKIGVESPECLEISS